MPQSDPSPGVPDIVAALERIVETMPAIIRAMPGDRALETARELGDLIAQAHAQVRAEAARRGVLVPPIDRRFDEPG